MQVITTLRDDVKRIESDVDGVELFPLTLRFFDGVSNRRRRNLFFLQSEDRNSLCLSDRLSHACFVTKRKNILPIFVIFLYVDHPRGTPPSGLNARGVGKYSDVGHVEGYISNKKNEIGLLHIAAQMLDSRLHDT